MLIDRPASMVVLGMLMAAGAVARPLHAQTPPAVNPQEEAEHDKLRAMKAVYEQAIQSGQPQQLAPLLAADFHGVMVTNDLVNSASELDAYWQRIHALMGEGGRYTTTVNPERSVIMGDVALARGTTDDVVTTGDKKEYRFSSRWTAVLQKQNGEWKLRAVHGSIDPIANPFVREFARRAMMTAVALSALGGFVVGGLATAIWNRRRRKV